MSKNILIITSSLRPNSNSDALAASFAKGAVEAGHNVETISLKGKKFGFCTGCMICQKNQDGHCIFKDDAENIVQKMIQADVLVFASPIYYYEMSGQLKVLLDRANPIYPIEYNFRDVYVLTTAADGSDHTPKRALNGIEGWIACFEHAHLAGSLFAGGVDEAGEIATHKALKDAYEMGKKV